MAKSKEEESDLKWLVKNRGEYMMAKLALVRPNDWNPNKVPEHKLEAIRHSMRTDGWLASQPLLIWETDERGRKKNIIIDGEHRWTLGNELGVVEAPMVFLKRIAKAKAMELTVKLDNNRGTFDKQSLATVLNEIMPVIDVPDPAAMLGFTQTEVNKILALPPVELDGESVDPDRAPTNAGIGSVRSQNAVTKMVPLYFSSEEHAEFMEWVKQIGNKLDLENVTDVVRHCVRVAAEGK